MLILPLVGYVGVVVGFCFLTLAIASGLYYLSELVEEHTVLTRRLLHRLIYGIIATHVLFWLVDSLPFSLALLSIVSHVVYASNLRRFPLVKLSDPLFLLSCLLVGLNHWVWFRHFSDPDAMQARAAAAAASGSGGGTYYGTVTSGGEYPTFTEIASFFGLCVWLVPFALFVSLSAGDNVLPSMGSEYATGGVVPSSPSSPLVGSSSSSAAVLGGGAGDRKGKNVAMAKAVVDGFRDWMGETGQVMGLWRGDKTRTF